MSELAKRDCVPCRGGVPPLEGSALEDLLAQVEGWRIDENGHLSKRFDFANFAEALDFVNEAGTIAEAQNHHPDLHLAWGKVVVEIWTHKIDGLSESDFVLAAKIDQAAAS